MIIKDNYVEFYSNIGEGNFSQRNNKLVWPSVEDKPDAQYRTSWKNMCNVTSYVNALAKAGFKFPIGAYDQPEDNLANFILESETIRNEYKRRQPAMYDIFINSLEGNCTERELNSLVFPNEIHDYLCLGANEWIGTTAAKFLTNVNFPKALWKYMVKDDLPIVISTGFGGFGHIVCCVGVRYSIKTYNSQSFDLGEAIPEGIIVDDPWGNASNSNFETYPSDSGGSGNNIFVPWDIVVKKVKPYNSQVVKWAHVFNHSVAII